MQLVVWNAVFFLKCPPIPLPVCISPLFSFLLSSTLLVVEIRRIDILLLLSYSYLPCSFLAISFSNSLRQFSHRTRRLPHLQQGTPVDQILPIRYRLFPNLACQPEKKKRKMASAAQSPIDIPSRHSTLASNASEEAVPDSDPSSVSLAVFICFYFFVWRSEKRQGEKMPP